jgi:hypothetical protein
MIMFVKVTKKDFSVFKNKNTLFSKHLGKIHFILFKYDHFYVLASKVQKVTFDPHKLPNCDKLTYSLSFFIFWT